MNGIHTGIQQNTSQLMKNSTIFRQKSHTLTNVLLSTRRDKRFHVKYCISDIRSIEVQDIDLVSSAIIEILPLEEI